MTIRRFAVLIGMEDAKRASLRQDLRWRCAMRNRQKWLMVSLSALIVVNVAALPSTLAALNELVGGGTLTRLLKLVPKQLKAS